MITDVSEDYSCTAYPEYADTETAVLTNKSTRSHMPEDLNL